MPRHSLTYRIKRAPLFNVRDILSFVTIALVLFALVSIQGCPLPDPSESFEQGTCNGPDWYRDPVTMAFKLDCASHH